MVYGASYCSFCLKAKGLLQGRRVNFTYLDVEEEEHMESLKTLQR